jgi:signal transduction histidine kinase
MLDDEPTNILIVDDLPEKLLAYRTILSELNQNIVAVGSGEEALRSILKTDFAVILLDVQMPTMNGLETAALIRRRKRSAHTPIIFLTAFADEVRAAEGYAQGAVDYITTPVVPAVLQAKVRVFCDLYRMAQQVRRQAEERIALAQERTRREAAEEANRRLTFSAMTGTVLGQSLDADVTAQSVARLPVPFLADVCALIFSPFRGGEWKTYITRGSAVGSVLEAGGGIERLPQRLVEGIERALAGAAQLPDGGSIVALPLNGHGQTFAALALSRVESGRQFGSADLTLAEAFASRAASALDNARLYREVEEANRQKNEFLSMLAHELRNPLAPIRNANEVLRQKATDLARVRWAQGVIDRQITHLVRLVDDLLDVSRLTQGKIRLEVEVLALEAVVEQAIEAARPVIDQFHHTLDVRLPQQSLTMTGDRARLTQVFTNLLNNAAKYTEEGGRIAISLEMENSTAVIRVRDSGIGIAPELLARVFDLFTQANRSLDRSQGGLGVGLTLVRRLVEMHNGTVEARSEGLGRGSEFVVRLPASPVTETERAVGDHESIIPRQSKSNGRLRVVVIDDNVDAAESLADLLRLLAHEVRVAHDGISGLASARAFQPDVVLLDIGLPGMDGYEVARQLRVEPGPATVLVAVSGYGRDEDRRLAAEAGIAHHFVKPIQFSSLQMLLDSIEASRESTSPSLLRNGSCST